MKRFVMVSMMMIALVSMCWADSAPRIVQCGVTPVSVEPGESFTLYADVSDADGLSDVNRVGLLAGDELVMMVPPSDTGGRFAVTYTMPQNVAPGTFTLSMIAADTKDQVSGVTYFTFSITADSPAVELLMPDDGEEVDCQGLTIFEWAPFSDEIGGYAFALYLTEGVRVVAFVPSQITSLPVPGALWSLIPDGTYFWQVGVVPKDGGEPYAWSELRSFNVACTHPWPTDVFGEVVEKDDANRTLLVRGMRDSGPHGITVQVTDGTIIHGANGELVQFEDIRVGDVIFAVGEVTGDVFVAMEIWIEQAPPGPGEEVLGEVIGIDLEKSRLTVMDRHPGMEVVIQVTEETIILNAFGPITLADVQLGDIANAFGAWEGDRFIATEIFIIDDPGPGPGDHYHGIIDAIDPDAMTFDLVFDDHGAMETIIVQVTEATFFDGPLGPLTFDDLEIGLEADVAGLWQEEMFVAEFVWLYTDPTPPGPQPMVVDGVIMAIDPNAWTLAVECNHDHHEQVVIQVTPDTFILSLTGPISFSDLTVGMIGTFHCFEQLDQILAIHIFIHDGTPPPPYIEIRGVIEAIDPDARVLMVMPFHYPNEVIPILVTDATVIEGPAGPMMFSDLQIGMPGKFMIDESMIASLITIFDPSSQEIDIEGTITAIDTGTMQLIVSPFMLGSNDVVVQVTDATMIHGCQGPMTFDDLQVDFTIHVHGVITGDLIEAIHIAVFDDPGHPGHG
ncbi:hypothetical protein JXA80_01975 [bacterium]|nr:hypothetical protein [candidate division CSSED10-310 bacterium]